MTCDGVLLCCLGSMPMQWGMLLLRHLLGYLLEPAMLALDRRPAAPAAGQGRSPDALWSVLPFAVLYLH